MDVGQGPVELQFEGGAVVHSWPFANSTLLRAGRFEEEPAVWSRPDGAEERMDAIPIEGAPVGERVERISVAVCSAPHGSWAPSWEFDFSGGTVIRVANSSGNGPATLEIDVPRQPRTTLGEDWVWWEVSADGPHPPGVLSD